MIQTKAKLWLKNFALVVIGQILLVMTLFELFASSVIMIGRPMLITQTFALSSQWLTGWSFERCLIYQFKEQDITDFMVYRNDMD